MTNSHLRPPRADYINPEYTIPLTPLGRPPFSTHISSSTLPATPQTPYHTPVPAYSNKSQVSDSSYTRIKPYLGLPARLLLTTLSPALLPLMLTIAHLLQNRSSTASLAESLKGSLLAACGGIATGAAGLLTMPRYLAMQTNDQAVRATQASILAISAAISDCVTIIETVVTFMVDTYRSMLMCTIELVVRGTLEVVIGAVQTISDGVTSSLNSVRTGVQSDIASANSAIQSAVSSINSLTNRININITIPEFSIPALSGLENVTIPTGFEDSLIRLNSSLPTLDELRDKINNIIEIPFEALKKEINETRIEMAASFNSSILPVPSLSQLSATKDNELYQELCSDLDTSLIDDTASALHKLSNVAIGLMFLLLFLIWAGMCVWEWRRWNALKETVETIEEEWKGEGRSDAWRAVAVVENPVLERYGSPILRRLSPNARRRTNMRWYLTYLAHPTCLALLCIAMFGFLSIQFQLVALNAIKDHARENANATVTQSANDLTSKLNQMALASSQQYATDFNAAIDRYEDRINNDLFGSWLNTTAVTLNSTLEEFYGGIEDALNTTFGGTILYEPVNTFMYCILGSKIDNLQKGLTWMSEHAQVSLPKLPPDVLLLSDTSMREIAEPISAAAVGTSANGDDQSVVGTLIAHFESALETERIFYAILLGVWLGFALIGLLVVLWHSGGSDRYDAWRGARPDDGGPDYGAEKRSWPWSKEHPIADQYQHSEEEKVFRGLSPAPQPSRGTGVNEKDNGSFLGDIDRGDDDKQHQLRPHAARNNTLGSTFSSLAAPGQAFLRLTGGGKADDTSDRLTDGGSSEKYNTYADIRPRQAEQERYGRRDDDDLEPPVFWKDRFFRAVDTAKSMLPTRGQKLGAALNRNGSVRTDASFGASQAVTPITPWARRGLGSARGYRNSGEPEWAMVDPYTVGRAVDALDAMDDDARYPGPKSSSYPRRLSRAPTLDDRATTVIGSQSSREARNVFADPAPLSTKKHDSVDYLREEDYHRTQRDSYDYAFGPPRTDTMSPAISASSSAFVAHDAHVESANRVQTGTAALASFLASTGTGRAERAGKDMGHTNLLAHSADERGGRF